MADEKYVMYKNGKFSTSDEGGGGGGSSTLAGLSDVLLTSIANGQILKWNATDEKFENEDLYDNNSIITPNVSGSGSKIFSKYIGYSAKDGYTSFPFVQFTGTWQSVMGIIISSGAGIYAYNLMVNGSYGIQREVKTAIIEPDSSRKPTFSYNSSTHILSVSLGNWEYGYFIGLCGGSFISS